MLAVALTHTWMTWWFGGLFMLVIVISEWCMSSFSLPPFAC